MSSRLYAWCYNVFVVGGIVFLVFRHQITYLFESVSDCKDTKKNWNSKKRSDQYSVSPSAAIGKGVSSSLL